MAVIFIDSERNYVHDVVDSFTIGQIAISCISWQDYKIRPVQFESVRYMHRLFRLHARFLLWYRWRTNIHSFTNPHDLRWKMTNRFQKPREQL